MQRHDHGHADHTNHAGHHSMMDHSAHNHIEGETATGLIADDSFSRKTDGLAAACAPEIIELRDGDTFGLTARPVRKRIGDATVRMLSYNGSLPGPTLRVAQGSQVTVNFTNETDLETTVHWHGLRLANEFDGVPRGHPHHGMQRPVPTGGSFSYRVRFPDPGVYWYHPHIREDYAQEMGLYGNIIVVPSDPAYWSPVNREIALTLDDILIEDGDVAPFSRTESNHTAMGRFGNIMLVNGETECTLEANRGEVVRLYLTNTANVRSFNVRIPGVRMKLVGRDHGRVEHEEFVEEMLLAPSERLVIDVIFEQVGAFALEHRTPERTYRLGTIRVSEQVVKQSYAREFNITRRSEELSAERARSEADFTRDADKTLALVGEMPGMDMSHHDHHGGHDMHDMHTHDGDHGAAHRDDGSIEWEDTMAAMNAMSTPANMIWKLIDRETGNANHDIWWSFKVGDRVKVRIVNEPDSDHPMQHPVHFHGQRFLVLSRDGVRNPNLAWKDTEMVTAGQTTDLLVEMSNPGIWMSHCHIAEHLEGGMMFSFDVEDNR
jgi:FtsP/CotA-like multicopper oxidase with cupredoxin domain